MRRFRLAVTAAAVMFSVVIPAGAAGAAVPSKVPPGCTVQPGRFQLLYNTQYEKAVTITSPAVVCTSTSKYTIIATYSLNRWYGTATGWKLERQIVVKGWNGSTGLDDAFDCKVSGALMSLTALYKYYKKGAGLVAQITYPGRTTALCSSAPKPPPG
jgi:hypothetical protein